MNAISQTQPETPEELTARQLHMCRELAELGMDLARAAARQAQQENNAQEAATSEPPKTTAHHLLFVRLCGAVRQILALEDRIAARHKAPADVAPPPPPDQRREKLHTVFEHITERTANRAETRRQASLCVEDALAKDPQGLIPVGDVFETICAKLGIKIDYAKVPDSILDLLCSDDPKEQDPPHAILPPFHPTNTGTPPP